MSQGSRRWIELDEQFEGRSNEAGLLTLGLAQVVTTFALWIGLWPEAFGIRGASGLTEVLAVLFVAAGALGFYMALDALAQEDPLGA